MSPVLPNSLPTFYYSHAGFQAEVVRTPCSSIPCPSHLETRKVCTCPQVSQPLVTIASSATSWSLSPFKAQSPCLRQVVLWLLEPNFPIKPLLKLLPSFFSLSQTSLSLANPLLSGLISRKMEISACTQTGTLTTGKSQPF